MNQDGFFLLKPLIGHKPKILNGTKIQKKERSDTQHKHLSLGVELVHLSFSGSSELTL